MSNPENPVNPTKTQEQLDAENKAKEAEVEAARQAEDAKKKAAAEAKAKAENEKKTSGKTTCFRSQVAGLAFWKDGAEVARFVPYYEKYQGDRVKVGYLEVSDPEIAELVEADANAEKISKKDFDKATTGKDAELAGY